MEPTPLPDTVKRRVVVGKSSTPIELPADTGLEAVLGADERTRIVSTELYPWKLICALDIEAPWGRAIGTGWLVGPRTLITAGHCVYDRKQLGGWAHKITVTSGRDRERAPFGSKVSARFSTLSPWLERQDADFDIAAIHLEQAFFTDQEVFRVGSFTDAELTDFLVNVSGYPASPGNGMELYWAKNRIKAVTPRRIFYDVDTSGGQSGGPSYIFPDENAHPIVVGIHAYGLGGTPASIGLRVNSAPRIIPEVVEKIQEWIAADAATG
ncbi:trypsin-like serine peptidase [Bosea caraganae]|uniref:trypsin-like serine peptidase n=1 Tax=Bosea caraganae TaxID=2763117 RepID=UPI0015F0ACC7|nr:trypsin-like peptidase domain-containing protein [Bosea caraganae]